MTTQTVTEEQRGKRRTAFRVECFLLLLLLLAIQDYGNAFEMLSLVLPSGLMYTASLRGLDAYFNPKRM